MKHHPENNGLHIDGDFILYNTLRDDPVDSIAKNLQITNDYTIDTLKFCREWLTGRQVFYINTSGSTGEPKTIEISRDQMVYSVEMTAAALHLTQGDHALVCLNTAYIAGKMMVVRSLHLGMNMTVIPPSGNPLAEFEVEGNDFDFTAMVPLQIQNILEQTPEKKNLLDRMKAILIGGGPINAVLRSQLQNIRCPVYATYGMTETITHIALSLQNGPSQNPGFKVLSGIQIDKDERGCLKVKGPVTRDQWVVTNDMVDIYRNHEFEWLGRADNVINSGGIKIVPEKLESAIENLLENTGIKKRFSIIGIPDQKLGEKIMLVVETSQLEEDIKIEIYNNLKKHLSKYEIPRDIIGFADFPLTETGKIKRKALRQLVIKQCGGPLHDQ